MNYRLSAAAERLGESGAVVDILKLAEQPDILSLAGGMPDSGVFLREETREAMERVLAQRTPEALNYSPNLGVTALREFLAERMGRVEGAAARPDEILVCSGGVEGIRNALSALTDPGDPLLVEDPTYLSVLHLCRERPLVPTPVATDEHGPLPEALAEAARRPGPSGKRPQVFYVVPAFQNPTGRTWPLDRRREILRVAEREDLVVIEDHAYAELWYDEPLPPSLKALAPDRVVFVHTFSKIFGPGLRLGWAAADPALIRRMGLLKLGTDQCSGALVQHLALEFGRSGALDEQVRRSRDLYRAKRDAMFAAARALPTAVPVARPGGGFFLWADFGDSLDTAALLPRAIERQRVAFVAGRIFYADPDSAAARGTLRLSFSQVPAERIPDAMERLSTVVAGAVAA